MIPIPNDIHEIADDIQVVREFGDGADDVGRGGSIVCVGGVGVGALACLATGLYAISQLGTADGRPALIIGVADVLCLACLAWVITRSRARARARADVDEWSEGWKRGGVARFLGVVAGLFLPAEVGHVKREEWCAELACIDSGWERTVYLLDLLGQIYQLARAARCRGDNGAD